MEIILRVHVRPILHMSMAFLLTVGRGPTIPLRYLAKSVLMNSKILDLDRPSQQNASYSINFQGPRLQCNETMSVTTESFDTTDTKMNLTYGDYASALNPEYGFAKANWTYEMSHSHGEINVQKPPLTNALASAPCPRILDKQDPDAPSFMNYIGGIDLRALPSKYTLIRSTAFTHCTVASAEYRVNVSFVNGIQQISHSIENERLMENKDKFNIRSPGIPPPMRSFQEYANILALIDALGENFDVKGDVEDFLKFSKSNIANPQPFRLANGSNIQACSATNSKALIPKTGKYVCGI